MGETQWGYFCATLWPGGYKRHSSCTTANLERGLQSHGLMKERGEVITWVQMKMDWRCTCTVAVCVLGKYWEGEEEGGCRRKFLNSRWRVQCAKSPSQLLSRHLWAPWRHQMEQLVPKERTSPLPSQHVMLNLGGKKATQYPEVFSSSEKWRPPVWPYSGLIS